MALSLLVAWAMAIEDRNKIHVRVTGISNTIGTADESLERNVWNKFAEGALSRDYQNGEPINMDRRNHVRDVPMGPHTRSA